MLRPVVPGLSSPPSEARRHTPSRGERARLTGLLLLSLAGFVLHWTVGLFTFVWFLGPFYAYAFHLTRPPRPTPHEIVRTRTILSLLLAFIPALLILAIITAFGVPLVPLAKIPAEVFVMALAYICSFVGIALAAHHVVRMRGTDRERTLFRRLRWPLTGLAAWCVLFLALHLWFRRPYLSVDYFAISGLGFYPAAGILATWLAIAGYRAYRPVLVVSARTPGMPAVVPTFSAFRG